MVDYDSHVKRGHPVVFGLIVFFSIIEGAIATWLIAKYDKHHDYPSTSVRDRTGFLTFTSWWTVLFGLIYSGAFLHSATGSVLTSVGSHGIFLIFTWIFWTAGAASITEALGGGLNCSNSGIVYCNQLNALEAFAWITWIMVTFALLIVLWRGFSASRRGDGLRGPLIA